MTTKTKIGFGAFAAAALFASVAFAANSWKNGFDQPIGSGTDNALQINGTMNVNSGATQTVLSGGTLTAASGSTVNLNGSTVFGAAPTGPRTTPVVQSALVGATVVLTAAQSGGIFENRSTSGSPSWTLPTCNAGNNGVAYTFTTANTTAGFTITGAQVVHAKTSASGTAITSTTTITNAQATAVVGDELAIACDGTAWWMTSQSGIFAAS